MKYKITKKSPTDKAKSIGGLYSPDTDPQGSYTGKPENPEDVPVQDADDL
jgi:hypothetical protein